MRYLRKYSNHFNEMAMITRKGKKVYVDDKKLLKDTTIEELDLNIAIIYMEKETFFTPPGKFWLYFTTDPKWSEDYKEGKSDILMFPIRRRFDFQSSPITDVWKKKHTKDLRNVDFIVGIVEGVIEKDKAYIEMMSTRAGYKRNTINKKLLDAIKEWKPELSFIWEDPTVVGLEFIKHYSGSDAKFRWTIKYRPKNWKTLYPKQAAE